eukprot:1140211-Pelagomonas_calceolata.AAC.2
MGGAFAITNRHDSCTLPCLQWALPNSGPPKNSSCQAALNQCMATHAVDPMPRQSLPPTQSIKPFTKLLRGMK